MHVERHISDWHFFGGVEVWPKNKEEGLKNFGQRRACGMKVSRCCCSLNTTQNCSAKVCVQV